MKKKLITVLLVLLSLCMIAAVVKIGKQDISRGSGGGADSSGGSSTSYSWIDPQTGVDIFAYPNLLTLSEGEDCDIMYDGGPTGDVATLHADGSIDIPKSVENLYSFTVNIGEYEFQPNYKYYFYYAYEIDGEYERCGLGHEDMTDGKYDIDFSVEGYGEVYEFGCWEPYSYESTSASVVLNVKEGLVGTSNSVNSGRFYLRVIAIPN